MGMLHCVHLSYWCPDGGHRRSCFSLWVHCWAEGFSHRRGFCCPGDVYSRLVKSSHLCIKYRFIQYRLFQSSFVVGRYCGGEWMSALRECSLPPSIPRLRWDPWARQRTPNYPLGSTAKMAAHSSGCLFTTHCCVCALGWVKCRAQIGYTCIPFLSRIVIVCITS